MTSAFAGIEKTRIYQNAPYLTPGQYELTIRSMSLVDSKKKRGQQFFVVEFDVISTTAEDFKAGDLVSWLVDMDHGETSLSNCKAFASAVLDCEEEKIDEATMLKLVGPDQPAAGVRIKANAFNIKTKSGADFTKVRWDSLESPAA
jgi:hypothetical protein